MVTLTLQAVGGPPIGTVGVHGYTNTAGCGGPPIGTVGVHGYTNTAGCGRPPIGTVGVHGYTNTAGCGGPPIGVHDYTNTAGYGGPPIGTVGVHGYTTVQRVSLCFLHNMLHTFWKTTPIRFPGENFVRSCRSTNILLQRKLPSTH